MGLATRVGGIFKKTAGLFKNKQVILLVIIGLLPLTWFKAGYLIRPEEVGYLDYSHLASEYLYAWSEHSTNGSPSSYSNQLTLFPIGFLYKATASVGLSPRVTQVIILVLFYQLNLVLSYLLAKQFTKSNAVAFFSSLFYSFSFYLLSVFFYTAKMLQMLLMPSFFFLFYKYLKTGSSFYSTANFFLLLVCLGIFANPANAAITFLIYPLCFTYILLVDNDQKKSMLIKRSFTFFVPAVSVLLYAFLVYYFSVFAPYLHDRTSPSGPSTQTFLNTEISSVFQYFKGAWWESQEAYNPWLSVTTTRTFILSSLVVILIVFLGCFTIKNKQTLMKYLFWSGATCLFIFFVKGTSEPFGFAYRLGFEYIPGFFILRESWAKFTPILIFSATIAFAFAIAEITAYRGFRWLLVIIFIVNAFPFFSGGPYIRNPTEETNAQVKIPQYWRDISDWSKGEPDTNVFALPLLYSEQEYYNWYGKRPGNFVGYLPATLLASNSIGVRDAGFIAHKEMFKIFSPHLATILNVDYVLDQKDVINMGQSSGYTVANLVKYGVIASTPDRSFGKLDLYRISEPYRAPRIYAAGSVWDFRGTSKPISGALDLPALWQTNNSRVVLMTDPKLTEQTPLQQGIIINPSRIKTVKKNFNTWDTGWPWPVFANVSPSSYKYNFVRSLEKLKLVLFPHKVYDKLDIELWYASKRVTELRNYRLDEELQDRLLQEYLTDLTDIFNSIKGIAPDARDDNYWGIINKIIMYARRSNQTLSSAGLRKEGIDSIYKAYDDFVLWVEDASNPTCTNYCYEFVAPSDGVYTLYTSKNSLRNTAYEKVSLEVKGMADGGLQKFAAKNLDDIWLTFGDITVNREQKYKLSFILPESSNLLSTQNWITDDTLLDYAFVRINPQTVISYLLPISENKTTRKKEQFFAQNQIFSKSIEQWEPGKNYDLTFDYYTEDGKIGIAIVEGLIDYIALANQSSTEYKPVKRAVTFQRELESTCPKSKYLQGECKSQFHATIAANEHTSGARIYVYGYGSVKSTFPEVALENLKIAHSLEPLSFLQTKNPSTATNPSTSYTRVNPTKYKVSVTGIVNPYTLVFNQNYNGGWRLYRERNIDTQNFSLLNKLRSTPNDYSPFAKKTQASNEHFIVNGYANAWLVNPPSTGDSHSDSLVIEYWPQRYFYAVWSIIVGSASFLASALLFKVLKKRNG